MTKDSSLTIQLLAIIIAISAGIQAHAQDSLALRGRAVGPEQSKLLENPSGASSEMLTVAFVAEQQMLADATALAVSNDLAGVWDLITADVADEKQLGGVRANRIGWRVASVVGALKNRNEYGIGDQLARFALTQPWCRNRRTEETDYWSAWLSWEGMGDPDVAKMWLGNKKSGESERTAQLREKVDAAATIRANNSKEAS